MDDLDPAFTERWLLQEAVKAHVADCIYELLRAATNAEIRREDITMDSISYRAFENKVNTTYEASNLCQQVFLPDISEAC